MNEWVEAPNQVLLVVFVSAYYLYREVERDGGREESIWRVGFDDWHYSLDVSSFKKK
jgi:hypothetical protein